MIFPTLGLCCGLALVAGSAQASSVIFAQRRAAVLKFNDVIDAIDRHQTTNSKAILAKGMLCLVPVSKALPSR